MNKLTEIEQIISENMTLIRTVLEQCSTESVVAYSMVQFRKGFPHSQLSSPAKQINLLLGILLGTNEPFNPKTFDHQEWEQIVLSLERLSAVYVSLYFPEDESSGFESEQSSQAIQVAMTAFLNYHETGLLASAEQVMERIKLYLSPFDKCVSESIGIDTADALSMAEYIMNQCQAQLDELGVHAKKLSYQPDSAMDFAHAVDRMGKITLTELVAQFGSVARAFWDIFTVVRGKGPQISYPTDQSIVEVKPLIRISEDVAILFNINVLFTAIMSVCEETLAKEPIRAKYLKHRDDTLEEQVTSELSRMLGTKAQILRNVYETPDNQFEHDLVIRTDDICLFVEAKASPPREPFRDPQKAFVRLRDSFHSDTGIQKAYDQSLRLFNSLREGKLRLFDKYGKEVISLPSDIVKQSFCICVTRDNYGPLATYLSFLLEKKEDEPYPWAINILDLGQIADLWQCYSWNGRQLRNFLSQRILLNKKAFSDDELDYIAAYTKNCGLHHFVNANCDWLQIGSLYATFLNAVYYHVHHGHPRPDINPEYPNATDLRESLKTGQPVIVDNLSNGPIQVGRNEPCSCGSQVKFKRCHGQ